MPSKAPDEAFYFSNTFVNNKMSLSLSDFNKHNHMHDKTTTKKQTNK